MSTYHLRSRDVPFVPYTPKPRRVTRLTNRDLEIPLEPAPAPKYTVTQFNGDSLTLCHLHTLFADMIQKRYKNPSERLYQQQDLLRQCTSCNHCL